jgi:hypothetical protein
MKKLKHNGRFDDQLSAAIKKTHFQGLLAINGHKRSVLELKMNLESDLWWGCMQKVSYVIICFPIKYLQQNIC